MTGLRRVTQRAVSQQQSDKHSPLVDDAMKDPRISSSEGTHHTGRPEDDTDETPEVFEPKEIHDRAEIARFLGPAAFPGDVDRLRSVASDNHATDQVHRALNRLTPGQTYETLQQVWEDVTGASSEI
jgi:hypothetical protein